MGRRIAHNFETIPAPVAYPRERIERVRAQFLVKRAMLPTYREEREHMALARYLTASGYLWNHADAGRKDATEKRRAARLGAHKGHPDFIIYRRFEVAGIAYPGLAIELKRVTFTFPGVERVAARKDPYLHQQSEYLRRLRFECGFVAEFARGAWEAISLVEALIGAPSTPLFG